MTSHSHWFIPFSTNTSKINHWILIGCIVWSSFVFTLVWDLIVFTLVWDLIDVESSNFLCKLSDLLSALFMINWICCMITLQVSVSCGIPDFRSRDGIYAKLSVEYPDLPDPQAMFDISYFCQNPRPFYKFAKVSCSL